MARPRLSGTLASRRRPPSVDGRATQTLRVIADRSAALDRDYLASRDEESNQLRKMLRIGGIGSWSWPLDDGVVSVSDVLLELFGLEQAFSQFANLLKLVHIEDRLLLVDAVNDLRRLGRPMTVRYRVIRASDGTERIFESRGIAERDRDGQITQLVGTVADVTELLAAQPRNSSNDTDLNQDAIHQQAVITAVPDVIHLYDVATEVLTRANRLNTPLIGFTDEMIQVMSGNNTDNLLPAEAVQDIERLFLDALQVADGEVVQLHHPVEHTDGETRWLSRRLTPFARNSKGDVTQLLVVSRDMTDIVKMEHSLEHAALHDDLTGLPNRRLALDRIAHSLRRAGRGGRVAVLACDLDGFKRINDAHGHRAGDEVLIEVAARLREAIRDADTVARIGGDEFVVVLDITGDQEPTTLAEEVARRIAQAVAIPITVHAHQHTVSVSIGISIDSDNATADSMLSDADVAMYDVKRHGANGHAFYVATQRPDAATLDDIERHIRRALADDTVEVYYQPIVNPATNKLHSVEALLRIRDHDYAFLNTTQVIDVAEHTGLIAALDESVLQIACARAAAWRQEPDLAELILNVNRSVKDITRPGFYGRIMHALNSTGLDPHALVIEITETVLLDASEDNLADLRALSREGIGLAIDDFGTGYASLRYLAELPITCIKLDRSFTNRIPDDPTAATLIAATIGLAEKLGITCTVEGVETIRQRDALPHYRALLLQGYLYAHPQSGDHPLPTHMQAGDEPALTGTRP